MPNPSLSHRLLTFSAALARKATTLFSLAHSWLLVYRDGLDPRSLMPMERLQYLELRPVLTCRPKIVVYDIGANVGEFACFLAKSPSVATIYCFEPLPQVFPELRRRTQNQGNIHCFPIALGDQTGRRPMYVNRFTPSSSVLPMTRIHQEELPDSLEAHSIEVSMMSLEDAVREFHLLPPDFIKIDVQGFEDRIIQGGRKILQTARFCMLELSLVTLYEQSALITQMNAQMRDLGFRLVKIVGEIKGKTGEILQFDGLYRNDRFASR
jgi:FkbM family methyltransferase